MATEQRKDPRVPSYAKAVLVDGHVPGYIRDLSRSGCQVAFMQAVPAVVGGLITIRVIAVHDPTILPFEVHLRVRRLIEDPPWHSLGTQVETVFDQGESQAFERLVEYYSRTDEPA